MSTKQFEWKDTPPENDGEFFYTGLLPNSDKEVTGIIFITHYQGKRRASMYFPAGWRGDEDTHYSPMLTVGLIEDWKGQWAGPEFGLTTVCHGGS